VCCIYQASAELRYRRQFFLREKIASRPTTIWQGKSSASKYESHLLMKSPRSLSLLKSAISIATLALCFGSTTVAQPGDRGPLFPGTKRPELNNRNELSQGYLTVYSATDQFDDGGVLYYAHSSYSIYTTDGKFFKNVENHISRSDEIPALVMLSTGSYIRLRPDQRAAGTFACPLSSPQGSGPSSIRTMNKQTYRNG
jgi:hypothetical protein